MRNVILGVCSSLIVMGSVLFPNMANAATSGGRGTYYIDITTQQDWSRPGTESIVLKSDNGVFTVLLDGKTYGTLKNKASLKVNLKRNWKHRVTVIYKNGSGTPRWYVADTKKIRSIK